MDRLEDYGRYVGALAAWQSKKVLTAAAEVGPMHPRRKCAVEDIRPVTGARAAGEVPRRTDVLAATGPALNTMGLVDNLDFGTHLRCLRLLLNGA